MALSHNELWLHSAAKKYDKTETFKELWLYLATIAEAAAGVGRMIKSNWP